MAPTSPSDATVYPAGTWPSRFCTKAHAPMRAEGIRGLERPAPRTAERPIRALRTTREADAFRRKADRAAAIRTSRARVRRGSCALPKTAGSPRATSAARAKRTRATAPPRARPMPIATPLKLAGSLKARAAPRKASASPSRSSSVRPSLLAALATAPRSTSPATICRADTRPNRWRIRARARARNRNRLRNAGRADAPGPAPGQAHAFLPCRDASRRRPLLKTARRRQRHRPSRTSTP